MRLIKVGALALDDYSSRRSKIKDRSFLKGLFGGYGKTRKRKKMGWDSSVRGRLYRKVEVHEELLPEIFFPLDDQTRRNFFFSFLFFFLGLDPTAGGASAALSSLIGLIAPWQPRRNGREGASGEGAALDPCPKMPQKCPKRRLHRRFCGW